MPSSHANNPCRRAHPSSQVEHAAAHDTDDSHHWFMRTAAWPASDAGAGLHMLAECRGHAKLVHLPGEECPGCTRT